MLFLGLAASARVALPAAGGCPLPNGSSLAKDPVVKQAIDAAWAASQPGTSGAHEEGGFILQCPEGDTWATKVEMWPPGDFDSIDHGPPTVPPGCQLVGEFHTHPPGPKGDPANDGYHNEQPSNSDETNADDYGVPGILAYAQPGDTGYEWLNYGPEEPGTECPDTPPSGAELAVDAALSAGEPHLRTFDGLDYDFQAAGEFVLTSDANGRFEIQARQEPTAGGHVTMNTAIAARIDGAVVEVNDTEVVVDGTPTKIWDFEQFSAPGGGTVRAEGATIRFQWADGSRMSVVGPSVAIVAADTHRSTVGGLLGDFDGRTDNDLVGPDGVSLRADGRVTFTERYGLLADAWRVTDASTLFTYPPGVSTATYDRRDTPSRNVDAQHLDPRVLARARRTCRAAGVRDQTLLTGCSFDVALTGRRSFATNASRVDREARRLLALRRVEPPLVAAVQAGQIDDVRALLQAGADPDTTDTTGRTALSWAVLAGRSDLAMALLDAGADPNIADDDGTTALHRAALFGLDDIADRLVTAGADTRARDDNGRTPADLAREQGHDDLADRLG